MFPDGNSFMCMVLFLVRREHLWTQVLQKNTIFTNSQFSWRGTSCSQKTSSSQESYTLPNTCMVKPRFHRCSLMVKVLCVWYYSWTGGSIFEPRFCKKHDFHKFSVFIKRHILQSKNSSSWEGYTLPNTCMVQPRFHRCSLMVTVLCVWYYPWSGGSIFEPRFCKKTWFSQILSFPKEAHFAVKKSLPLKRVIPYPTLVWWWLGSIDVPWW